MIPAIMKVGTMPANHYWLWGNKPLSQYKQGDVVKFIKQKSLVNVWERGIIREMVNNFPFVELF